MKKITLLLLILPIFMSSCGAHKKMKNQPPNQITVVTKAEKKISIEEESEEEEFLEENAVISAIIDKARDFLGTKYRYGGTTDEGMDCSGLVYTSFLTHNISLPRSSRDMSLLGERLNLNEVTTGDLLFFETDKKKKVINHVGLIVQLDSRSIYFIHSTSSRGVIISSMDEGYWREHFVMARRIL